MTYRFEEIVSIISQRQQLQSTLMRKMIQVRDRYNGDVVIPMPGDGDELPLPPLTPALIANAIDNTALRAATVQPSIKCPALDPTGSRSVDYANTRRRALAYTWRKSHWQIACRRALRHLAGYATTAIYVMPDFNNAVPQIVVRDPLTTYPEPRAPEDLDPICNCAFVYGKSVDWLAYTFPESRELIEAAKKIPRADVSVWDVCEWVDDDEIVVGLLGPRNVASFSRGTDEPLRWTKELRRWPNKAGMCTAYTPRRVTMDQISTQVANMVGMVDLMARLVQLDIRATEQSIFPDRYVIAKAGQSPQLVSGSWKSGATGEVNIITDADGVGVLRGTPDPHNDQTVDRMERAANISMGVVPQQGGETYGALRTGRGIDTLMGASVDPRIQELHELLEVSLEQVNRMVIGAYKGYWGSRSYSVYSGWASDRGQVHFTPSKHFETDDNAVNYPLPGADIQGLTVGLGQLYGTKAISLHTMRELHPWVDDAESEENLRLLEELESALHASVLQRAAQGGIPPVDAARIVSLVREGKSLEEAIAEADKEAQARQASQAPPPQPEEAQPGEPQMVGAPQAQPGLGNPGEGGQMQPPDIGPPQPSVSNLQQLVRALKSPVPAGQGAPAA